MATSVWSSPLAVYVIATLAVALALVEVALPTLGVAGTSAGVLMLLGLWGVDARHHPWWPFVVIGFAFALWAVELVRGSTSLRWPAAAAFGAGSLSFGLLTHDVATAALGAAVTVAFTAAFPPLAGAMARLNAAESPVGMGAVVGRPGTVDRWAEGRGTVVVDGSRWNAVGPPFLEPGTAVTVTDHDRMTLTVTPIVTPQPTREHP